MILVFYPQFIPAILSGQQGFVLKREISPAPVAGETISMVTGDHGAIITNKHTYKGCEEVCIIIKKKAAAHKPIIFLNGRPLSDTQTMSFCFLNGFNSLQEFCDYWLHGANEIEIIRFMYRWIDLPF